MKSIDPVTEEAIKTYEEYNEATVGARSDAAWGWFESWHETPISRHEKLLAAATNMLRKYSEEYATLITKEIGKPVEQAASKVEKCTWVCDYCAEHVSGSLQDKHIDTVPGSKAYVSYEPIDPVLVMMPRNSPFWRMFWFTAPHITAGNAAALKYAPSVFGCASAIASVFERTNYPDDVSTSPRIPTERVTGVIEDGRARGVSLTGSTRAGRAIMETNGRELKPAVLELSGSDPLVVLDDAPFEATAKRVARARTQNNGQSCIAAKRSLVHEIVYDEFVERFTREIRALTVGDPIDSETDVGPQARADLIETLHEQVTASIEADATLRLGGEPLDRPGHYYPSMALTDMPGNMSVRTEELFGLVTIIIRVEDEAEAARVTNNMSYDLGASVWMADTERDEALTTKLTMGNVTVNHVVAFDPRVPSNGTKGSGYGTELSQHGIRELANTKTV